MTVFTGIIRLENKKLAPDEVENFKHSALRSLNIPRFSNQFITDHFCSFQFDISAFKYQFLTNETGDLTVLAGQPILSDNGPSHIEKDFSLISDNKQNLPSLLKSSRGTFSGLVHEITNSRTTLFTDKVGIRPIFYLIKADCLFYSSNFSVLKDYFYEDLTLSEIGIKEYLTLGYSLQDRTTFKEIKRLQGGEFLSIDKKIEHQKYWEWKERELKAPNKDFYTLLFNKFQESVKLRSFEKERCYSFLSGGMDSRIVTSSLIKQGKKLTSFNFQTSHCQDTEFSKMYAREAGIDLRPKLISKEKFFGWSKLIAESISQLEKKHIGQYVWSGDGGAPLGGVYLTQSIVDKFNISDNDGVREFLRFNNKSLATNFFSGKLKVVDEDELIDSITKSLPTYETEKAKRLFHFLLVNNQARALQYHHETIHLHKVELALPFFDAEFISSLFQLPMSEILYHKAYSDWFELFPLFTRKTPWQTYPGHVECPIKNTDKLSHQWQKKSKTFFDRFKEVKSVLDALKNKRVRTLMNRPRIILGTFMHLLNLRDNSYLVAMSTKLNTIVNQSSSQHGNRSVQHERK